MSAPDMEKVVKGLGLHLGIRVECSKCPYVNVKTGLGCARELMSDALTLLKEQDERIKLLEHQLETLTKWRMNAGAFD